MLKDYAPHVSNQLLARHAWVKFFPLLGVVVAALSALFFWMPYGIDWHWTYRPAALAVLGGESPYSVEIYYAAPWAAWLLIPIAVLPTMVGRVAIFLLGVAAYTYTAWKLGARRGPSLLFLCSTAVIGCLINGNIEWMALLGIVCPPWLGLILLAVKPQVGAGLGVYWLVTIWREHGFKKVILTFTPVTVLLIVSVLLYGLWPLRFSQTVAWSTSNGTLFPYGIILGVVILAEALRRRHSRAALASGPFFSPYVLSFTWIAMLAYLLDRPRLLAVAVVVLWIPTLLEAFS